MTGRETGDIEKGIMNYIDNNLPEDLRNHIYGMRDFALEMNRRQSLGLNEEKIVFAALCHDLARRWTVRELRDGLRKYGRDPDSIQCVDPVLLHCEMGAAIAENEFGVTDEEVLRTIRIHATGAKEMSLLDKVIYIADRCEWSRDYPGVDEFRDTALRDVKKAFPRVIASTIKYVVDEGWALDYNSIAAYNASLEDL